MAIDAGANHEAGEPDDELDAEAEERAADEGMPPPDEDPETSGELESQKLDHGHLPSHSRSDERTWNRRRGHLRPGRWRRLTGPFRRAAAG